MRSASLFIKTPRCEALILRHGPLSDAARAAATALSTSGASASATCVITSPVEGLIVGKVFPDVLSTHFPLISNFVGPILIFGCIVAIAVAILESSSFQQSVAPSFRAQREPLPLRAPFARRNLSSPSMTKVGAGQSPSSPA